MISKIWKKLTNAICAPANFVLSESAKSVLVAAQAQGYQVSEDTRQGTPAIVLTKDGVGKVHFWSNDDIVEYGRNKKLL